MPRCALAAEDGGRKRKAEGEAEGKGAAKYDKACGSVVGMKEVSKEDLKLRIIHALVLRDLTCDHVSRQCLRGTSCASGFRV